jgi:hypothetical protein
VKTLWDRLSIPGRIILLLTLGTAALGLVVTARRDLHTRDPDLIRGNPDVWNRITVMPGGAAAYLSLGRRKHPQPDP